MVTRKIKASLFIPLKRNLLQKISVIHKIREQSDEPSCTHHPAFITLKTKSFSSVHLPTIPTHSKTLETNSRHLIFLICKYTSKLFLKKIFKKNLMLIYPTYKNLAILFFFFVIPCSLWDLSSLTRDQMQVPNSGSAESQPLDHQAIS